VDAETPVPPPQASKVVDLASVRRGEPAAGPSEHAPPPAPDESASAPAKGKGGKREKKIDWGRFSYMVENFVLIYPTDTAWDKAKRKQVKIANMGHMFGADYVRMWKSSPDRQTVDEEDLVFDPTMTCGEDAINLYDGFAIEPTECDGEEVDVMLELLEHLCSRCQPGPGFATVHEVMQWVLRWLALPLQRPGAKPRSSLVFHGPQGTGKNLFFDVIRGIYGKYGVMVGQTELEEKYNGWLSAKLLVIGNEVVSRQELYHNKNRLKWIITEENIPIRTMNTDTRWEANHANLVFLSNERQPLVLEIGDRRYLVVYTPTPENSTLYDRVRAFLANDGAAKFFHFLLQYPLGDFHEHTKPPMTEAKEELIGLSMKPAERFMREWVDGYLELPMQVCSSEQLYKAFRRWCDDAGERWPPPREAFSLEAKRWAIERVERDAQGHQQEPCLVYKVATAPAEIAGGRRQSVRAFLPRGTAPPEGVSEGAWVKESIDAFELPLGRFLRHRGAGDESPPPPRAGKKGAGDAES
jgi:putative DNA primase/helicase